MTILPIYYQEKPRAPRELWAYRQGKLSEIETSARNLLEELHEEGFARARVWVGKLLVKKQKAQPEEEKA